MGGLEARGVGLVVREGFRGPIGGLTARGASELVCSMLGLRATSVGRFPSKLFLPMTSTLGRLVGAGDSMLVSKTRSILGRLAGSMLVRRCSPPALEPGRLPSILGLFDSVFFTSTLVFRANDAWVGPVGFRGDGDDGEDGPASDVLGKFRLLLLAPTFERGNCDVEAEAPGKRRLVDGWPIPIIREPLGDGWIAGVAALPLPFSCGSLALAFKVDPSPFCAFGREGERGGTLGIMGFGREIVNGGGVSLILDLLDLVGASNDDLVADGLLLLFETGVGVTVDFGGRTRDCLRTRGGLEMKAPREASGER